MFWYRPTRALVNVPIKAGDRGSSPQLSNVPTSAGEIKSISKSNEKNVNGNGNSPGGRTRENLVWSSSAGDLLHAGLFRCYVNPVVFFNFPTIFKISFLIFKKNKISSKQNYLFYLLLLI